MGSQRSERRVTVQQRRGLQDDVSVAIGQPFGKRLIPETEGSRQKALSATQSRKHLALDLGQLQLWYRDAQTVGMRGSSLEAIFAVEFHRAGATAHAGDLYAIGIHQYRSCGNVHRRCEAGNFK